MTMHFPRESAKVHPPSLFPYYTSTIKRAPKRPLIILPHTETELTAPAYGHEVVRPEDADLTRQHEGEPLGQRIIVSGRVLDEDGRAVANTLLEVWQANAAGRYVHLNDQHDAPLDPHFSGAGRVVTDEEGRYRFITIRPGAYSRMRAMTRGRIPASKGSAGLSRTMRAIITSSRSSPAV
jgi:protocatechuate 3,4-dioxygenase beta subunit